MDDAVYTEMAAQERTFWWFAAKRRILTSLIGRYLVGPPDDGQQPKALDIGCGTGALLEDLARLGFEAVGCDNHPASFETCRRRGLAVSTGTLPDDLPHSEPSFDVIVLSDVLEHVDEDRESVEAVTRLLRPGGLLVCTVPAHPWLWTRWDDLHHHKRRYRHAEYRRLFAMPELTELLFSYYNSFLFPLMVGARIVSRWRQAYQEPNLTPPPAPLNTLLRTVFASERSLLGRIPLPLGGSLISVHRHSAKP